MTTHSSKMNQRKLFLKIGFILVLILLLMIPNALIQNLIHERQSLESQTQREIASSWGPSQKVMGPILSIPYTTTQTSKDGTVTSFDHTLRILPQALSADIDLTTEERKKSIYKAILYNAHHDIRGSFELPDTAEFGKNLSKIHWADATIDMGFSASSSLSNIVTLKWNNDKYKMQSGSSDTQLFPSAIHTRVKLNSEIKTYNFEAKIGVNGSKSIKYIPLASNTRVTINSNWPSPGFVGLPLPTKREISEGGFTATWNSTEYNRPFKDTWKDTEVNLSHRNESFGVDLVQTVGHYQKNMRSAKYALLIISLSFLVFFFFEILKNNKIHPVQYIFIGLALSIFYSLLLSFSELVGFGPAYLIAASAVVGLISWYGKFMLRQGSNVMILTTILAGLYTYIYILLQMEKFALLVGTIGLFVVLAISMYLSRNMDWYGLKKQMPAIETDNSLV